MRKRVVLGFWSSTFEDRDAMEGVGEYVRQRSHWILDVCAQLMHEATDLLRPEVDGAIINVQGEHIPPVVAARGLPVVNAATAAEQPVRPLVAVNNDLVGRLAAEHLLERGFRHFGVAGMRAANRFAFERGRSFIDTVARAGCAVDTLEHEDHYYDWNQAPSELAGWLVALPKPVGVFTCFDVRARHVVDACRELDIAIPEQLAVVGAGNDTLVCRLAEVPISSVDLNSFRRGYEAAQMLDRLMDGQPVPPETRIDPVGVVTRRSTDVLAIRDPVVAQAIGYIRRHVDQPLQVEDVLGEVPVSRRSLERRFREELGRSPSTEICRLRLIKAQELMARTDLNMAEIAAMSGFADAVRFSRTFRRELGMTPTAWRERRRGVQRLPERRDPLEDKSL